MTKDDLFIQQRPNVVDFQFDQSVANVFTDMIRRSVPGYETMTSLIGSIAAQYAKPETHIYDLGCSLGATTLSIYSRVELDDVVYVCVDNSRSMLDKCTGNLKNILPKSSYLIVESDIQALRFEPASVIVMNFTLQFIRPENRKSLMSRINDALVPGGILVLSEKVSFSGIVENAFHHQHHRQFKKDNGYSELEISQKRSALENVMILDSAEIHMERLFATGFETVYPWFQAFNFVSYLAHK